MSFILCILCVEALDSLSPYARKEFYFRTLHEENRVLYRIIVYVLVLKINKSETPGLQLCSECLSLGQVNNYDTYTPFSAHQWL